MASFCLFFFFLLLPLLLLHRKRSSRNNPSLNLPPGPRKLPIIGNLHQLLSPAIHRRLWQLSKRHGSLLHLQLGAQPAIAISSAKLAREVLKTQDLNFCGRPEKFSHKTVSYNFLDVAFAPYGDYWREMRKVCTLELFSSKQVQRFGPIREQEVASLVGNVAEACFGGGAVNLTEMLVSLTNNVTCRTAMGKSYQVGMGERSRFHELLDETLALSGTFFAMDHFPFLGWVDLITGKKARLMKAFMGLDRFYEQVIGEHLDPERVKPEGEDLVDVLLRVQTEKGLTRDHIKGVLMNIFLGGTESSSVVMEWAMAELMRNKQAMKSAQEEVRRVVGRRGKVEETDLHHLHHLKLVIKETLRLHTPAPLLVPHATVRDCTVNGYGIAAKTWVFINVYAISRDPEAWEQPERFMPERFLNRAAMDYGGTDFEFLPFGAGRRVCPGISLGMTIVELALANLLYCFDWELPPGMTAEAMDMDEAPGIAMHRKSPLLLHAQKAAHFPAT